MYPTLRQTLIGATWPRKLSRPFKIACPAPVRGTLTKLQKDLQFLLAAEPLEFFAMDKIDGFPKSKNILPFSLKRTLFKDIPRGPMLTTTAETVSDAFLENRVLPHVRRKYVLTHNRTKFV